jgi:hypothetical protein
MNGRPVLGAISGFFFGVFLSLALMMFGIWPLDALSVFGLPLIFLVIGLLLAAWAPLGRGGNGSVEAP